MDTKNFEERRELMGKTLEFKNVDEYIELYKDNAAVYGRLVLIRKIIRDNAESATEKISWGMPTYHLIENLVHFASHKNHLGFYPGAEAIEVFAPRLSEYHTSKGAIQFPHNKPLPEELIADIVKYRVSRVLDKKKK